MKLFIDRFSDLLISRKPLGRKLRGCRFALLSTGSDPNPDQILNQAFSSFCEYLGVNNIGMIYSCEDGPFVDEAPVRNLQEQIKSG